MVLFLLYVHIQALLEHTLVVKMQQVQTRHVPVSHSETQVNISALLQEQVVCWDVQCTYSLSQIIMCVCRIVELEQNATVKCEKADAGVQTSAVPQAPSREQE
jgi:hypothetical protein